jgi:hypothetical protein
LPHCFTGWRDAEQHAPTLTVGEGAKRAAGPVFLGGGFLEFKGVGFTGTHQSLDLRRSHSQVSS